MAEEIKLVVNFCDMFGLHTWLIFDVSLMKT